MDLSGQGIDRLVSDRRDLAFAVLERNWPLLVRMEGQGAFLIRVSDDGAAMVVT